MKKILQIGVCVVEIPEFSFKKKKLLHLDSFFFFFSIIVLVLKQFKTLNKQSTTSIGGFPDFTEVL